MFTSRSLFSDVVCPYSQICVLPRCIFKHPNGERSPLRSPVIIEEQLDTDVDQERSRKKQKLDNVARQGDTFSVVTQPTPGQAKTSVLSTANRIVSKPTKNNAAAIRAISPPALGRKPRPSTFTPIKVSPNQVTSTPKSTATPIAKNPAKTPVKTEGLNPRALKGPTPTSHDMRFRLLRALHEQLARLNLEVAKDASDAEEALVLSDQAIITKALDIEEDAAASPSIYSNLVKNKILYYKRMSVKTWVEEREKEIAADKAKNAPALVIKVEPNKPIATGLTLPQEIVVLKRLQSDISTLAPAGFIISPPSETEIASAKAGVEAAKGWEVCDRCRTRFQVFPLRRESDGALASGGVCTYHSGKAYFPPRGPNDPPRNKREKRYRCCNESIGDSTGCTKGEYHVFKVTEPKRLAAVLQFERTPENEAEDMPICIDGEMGYTTYGLELIRLTATRWPGGECLFDVLVKPIGLVLDLNSRYSGVWPKDYATALPYIFDASNNGPAQSSALKMVESPAIARRLLFQHMSPSTPLIGHGLENDLNATRIIHPTIVDTALLFPHRAGLPFRHGLKALMKDLLGRDVQMLGGMGESGNGVATGNEESAGEPGTSKGGHDSKEDANAAGELVRYAIKEEWARLRREGWTVDIVTGGNMDDGFIAPGRERGEKALRLLLGEKDDGAANTNAALLYDPLTTSVADLTSDGFEVVGEGNSKKRGRFE